MYEFWIGARYSGMAWLRRFKRRGSAGRDRFVSFIAVSSMAGIGLGVAALIVVLSVMNGFQKEVRDRMLSVLPHIELFVPGASPAVTLPRWRELVTDAERNPAVLEGAPFVAAQAMLARGQALRGVQVRGVDAEYEGGVSDLPAQMVQGQLSNLKPGGFGIVLGRELAGSIGVGVGDTLLLMAPEGSISPAGMTPRMRQFTVVGLFASGHYEYDSTFAFVQVEDAARVFRQGAVAGARLRISDMQQAPRVAAQLPAVLPPDVLALDWSQNNRAWFAAVQTEKRMMFLILALIVAVAAFNLLSSLVMTVKDKRSDIAILRTLGASPASVARIFLVQGALIGIVGTVLGVAGGTLVALNVDVIVPAIERLLGVHFIPQQIYFINQLPSDPRAPDILMIGGVSLVLSFVATLYPSWRASRLQPASVLRHD